MPGPFLLCLSPAKSAGDYHETFLCYNQTSEVNRSSQSQIHERMPCATAWLTKNNERGRKKAASASAHCSRRSRLENTAGTRRNCWLGHFVQTTNNQQLLVISGQWPTKLFLAEQRLPINYPVGFYPGQTSVVTHAWQWDQPRTHLEVSCLRDWLLIRNEESTLSSPEYLLRVDLSSKYIIRRQGLTCPLNRNGSRTVSEMSLLLFCWQCYCRG
jgi:hypothetical protein